MLACLLPAFGYERDGGASRSGPWVLGIAVCHATPLATSWRWWTGRASGVALSESDALAHIAAKADGA